MCSNANGGTEHRKIQERRYAIFFSETNIFSLLLLLLHFYIVPLFDKGRENLKKNLR